MAFDPSLDKELFKTEKVFNGTKLVVSVMSYNEGRPKVQISRQNYDSESERWQFARTGRFTAEECDALIEMLKEAKQNL